MFAGRLAVSSPSGRRASSTRRRQRGVGLRGPGVPNVGFNAVVGRPVDEYSFEPTRFDQMRRGAWTRAPASPTWTSTASTRRCTSRRSSPASPASGCSSSPTIPTRAGVRAGVERLGDRGLGRVRARPHDPVQIPYLLDPEVGAEEIDVTPARVQGDDVLRGAAPARVAVVAHRSLGSADGGVRGDRHGGVPARRVVGHVAGDSPDAPSDTIGALFFGYAMFAAVDWLYSRIPVRFPEHPICLSEGGIGWVAGLLDRLEHVRKYDSMYGTWNDVARARPTSSGATSGCARSTILRRSCSAT